MRKRVILFLSILFFIPVFLNAQQLDFVGVVVDKETGEAIEGANILLDKQNVGTVSNAKGQFVFQKVKQGKHTLIVSFIGYQEIRKNVEVKPGISELQIKLHKANTVLKDVNVAVNVSRQAESILKIPALLKDIPVTTTSVNRDLIEQTQVDNINDALKYATGIKPMINYGGFQTFVMRGFGAPVVMLDGARDERMNFSNSAPLTSLASVERIEYLKGPTSVLYGHSAVGGIVNIVRKQPSNHLKAHVSTSYGSWETKKTTIGFGDRISDKLCYRFDGGFSDTKGWRDAADKTLNGYFALNYELDENNIFELRLAGNDDTYGTETGLPAVTKDIYSENGQLLYANGKLPSTFKLDQRYNDPVDFLDHENVNVSLKYIHSFWKDSKLQVHASYSDDLIDYFSTEELSYLTSDSPIYNTYYMNGDEKTYISLDTLQRTFPLRFSHETNTFQNFIDYSIQFVTGDVKHKLNVGHFFMYVDRTSFTGYKLGQDVTGAGLFAKISVVDPVLNQGDLQTQFSGARIYRERVNGLYAQDLIEVSEKLNFLAALRFDHYHMEKQTSGISSGRNKIEKTPTKTIVNKALTYRLGAVYQPKEDLSLYASYASFFKPKRTVYNDTYIYLDKDGKEFFPKDGEELFEPEDGYQFETGIKYDYSDKLQINASAYYIKKNNIVEYLGKSDDGNSIYGQVGVIDSKGFDFELNYRPVDALNILAGYGFNEAKYVEFSANDYTNSKEGNSVRNNPKNRIFVWAYYQVPKGVFENFNLGLGVDYTDKLFTNSSNTYELPSYWLFDAAVGYNFNKMYLKLKINNLFDKEYFSSSVYSSQYIPGRERNLILTVGLKL